MSNFLKIFLILFATLEGTCGPVFPIEEESLLEVLQSQEIPQPEFRNPHPIEGIKKAEEYRVFYYDPTITLRRDIKDSEGNLIAEKGTRINPLHEVTLEQPLLFFDADDPDQVTFAKECEAMWILVRGNPFELEKQEKTPTYFDQFGLLVKKLGIEKVPSKVSQESALLKIEEIPVKTRSSSNCLHEIRVNDGFNSGEAIENDLTKMRN